MVTVAVATGSPAASVTSTSIGASSLPLRATPSRIRCASTGVSCAVASRSPLPGRLNPISTACR